MQRSRAVYALTDHGHGLSAVMGQLERWGAEYLARQAGQRVSRDV